MADEKLDLLSLEKELTSVAEDALEEERENVRHNFNLLEAEKRAVHIPYPDVHKFDTGVDYEDISRIQFMKGQNERAWKQIEKIDLYLDCEKLFIGHCLMVNGQNYYIMDRPSLLSRTSVFGDPAQWINVDDRNYEQIIRMWQYPAENKNTSFSRNIQMHGRKVDSVDVKLDRSNQLVSGITDMFLRKALIRNKNKSGIESIIQTIQEKQDTIRLLPRDQSFIVQGCAGSGKTMVLLHRLRYLLFNKELNDDDYLFLIPTQKFGRFIRDISAQFQIHETNVVPIQSYYKTLAGERKADEKDETSELVYPPDYLKRVYSRAFIQDALRELIHTAEEQMDTLVAVCDSALSEVLKKTTKQLQDEISDAQQNAFSMASEACTRVLPYTKIKLASYSDIGDIIKELQDAYDTTSQNYQRILHSDISPIEAPPEIIAQNPQLQQLQKDLEAAEKRADQASIFTVRAQRRKAEAIKKQYDDAYAQAMQAIIAAEQQKREEQAAMAMFVYDDVVLEEAKAILNDLIYISGEAQKVIDTNQGKLDNIEDTISENYSEEIELLNEAITISSDLASDCSDALNALTPVTNTILNYLHKGSQLATRFRSLCALKERRRVDNQCKMFKERNDHDNAVYLNRLLFEACKKLIRNEFDVKISKTYKHYWYLALYCQYLTKGIAAAPRHYLYIDEAQDLSPSEIELIWKVNMQTADTGMGAGWSTPVINLFGDVNQMITQHGISDWGKISFIRNVQILDENFRNTNQIVDFCNRRLPFSMKKVGVDLNPVSQYPNVAAAVKTIKQFGRNLVFIVKDDYALKDLHDLLAPYGISDYEAYSVKDAKGLEFKSVCVFDARMTKNETYIAYTRALADLIVIHELPLIELNHVTMIVAGEESEEEMLEDEEQAN